MRFLLFVYNTAFSLNSPVFLPGGVLFGLRMVVNGLFYAANAKK